MIKIEAMVCCDNIPKISTLGCHLKHLRFVSRSSNVTGNHTYLIKLRNRAGNNLLPTNGTFDIYISIKWVNCQTNKS